MPTFFRTNELTEQQKANWDTAIDKYSKVMRINALRYFKGMSESERKRFMSVGINPVKNFTDEDVLQKIQEMLMITGNQPGHEKSALFFRIISGKKLLKNAPPTSYSYPDYEIVESNEARAIPMMDSFDIKFLIKNKSEYTPFEHILINQSAWKVLKVVSPKKVSLTHGHWEKEGFVWELELKDITAKESQSAIICHHDPENGKITTYDELVKECHFHALNHFYLIRIAQDENEFKKFQEKESQKYGDNAQLMVANWVKANTEQSLANGKKMLEDRFAKGLPAYPTEDEINEYAKQLENNYLRDEYYVKDGLIYQKAWMIKRVFPACLSEDHYLSESEFD